MFLFMNVSLKVEAGLWDIVRMMQVLIKLGLTQFLLGHASVWMLGRFCFFDSSEVS